MIKEESCLIMKNIADFVKISPSMMTIYLLEGALYYEYKNLNKICKKMVSLDKIIMNNIHFIYNNNNNNSCKGKKNIKIPNNVSIFEILYGLSGTSNENNPINNRNEFYGNDKKIYKEILKILFNNEKLVMKQFLNLLNNIIKLLLNKQFSKSDLTNINNLIFKLENDFNYIKEIINSKIVQSEIKENNEEEISKNIYSAIDLIIKNNFTDKALSKYNNDEIKNKLIRNTKLIISKLLHLLFKIQIKINLLLFENKGTSQSKINYIYLLSQALLCENNQKISKKIISDILMFIKLLNIKKIL
jgi:hypothetical protein